MSTQHLLTLLCNSSEGELLLVRRHGEIRGRDWEERVAIPREKDGEAIEGLREISPT